MPVIVAAWLVQAGDKAECNRFTRSKDYDRNYLRRRLCRKRRRSGCWRDNYIHLPTNQICGKCRQLIVLTFRPLVLERYVHVFSIKPASGASSARPSSESGTVRPSALGDLEVDDQLNFHGLLDRQTGGIGAVGNTAGIDAGLAICIGKTGSVAHQAAGRGELTQRVNRRQRVARRKCDELSWPGDEELIDVDAERADSILNERGEGCLKVAIGAGLNDRDFRPSASAAACTSLVSDSAFGLIGFTRNPIEAVLGTVSCSTSNCLGNKLLAKKFTPVTFPPGRLRLDNSKRDGIGTNHEDDRNGCARCLRGTCHRSGTCNDHSRLALD